MNKRVNILGPYIETIPPPLQIITMGSIDLKTMPVVRERNLWRAREIGKVGFGPPRYGPVYGQCTVTLGMCAHGLGGKRDELGVGSVTRTSSPDQLNHASRC